MENPALIYLHHNQRYSFIIPFTTQLPTSSLDVELVLSINHIKPLNQENSELALEIHIFNLNPQWYWNSRR